jgi:hypothetical protein
MNGVAPTPLPRPTLKGAGEMKFREIQRVRFRVVGNALYEYEKLNDSQAMISRIIYDGPESVKQILSQPGTVVDLSPETKIIMVAAA